MRRLEKDTIGGFNGMLDRQRGQAALLGTEWKQEIGEDYAREGIGA